ncbi:G-protein-signaling modulator 2 [Porites harrisoni]
MASRQVEKAPSDGISPAEDKLEFDDATLRAIAEVYNDEGNKEFEKGEFHNAVYFYTEGIKVKCKDDELNAKLYRKRASAYRQIGNFTDSLDDARIAILLQPQLQESFKEDPLFCVEREEYEEMYQLFHNKADARYKSGHYKEAMYLFASCLKIAQDLGERVQEGVAYANLASCYFYMKDYNKAIEFYELSMNCIEETDYKDFKVYIYTCLGDAHFKLKNFKKAIDNYQIGLQIIEEKGDVAKKANMYKILSETYSKTGDYKWDIHYQELRLKASKEIGDRTAERNAYFKLASAYYHSKDSERAIKFCELYLNDSLWRVLIDQDKITEGLVAAEQGRAQALKDLMESNYGLKTANGRRTTQEMSKDDILSCISSVVVFTATYSHLNCFWVLRKESVCLRKLSIEYDVQSMLEVAREKIGVRDGAQCEDRSLDRLRNNEEESEGCVQRRPAALPNQDNPFRTLYELTISPIIDLIHGDELIVVPEGPLWLAPYAAFKDPNSRYLSESFRIRFIPSLLSLKIILDCPADYHAKNGALLVGDPWVEEVKLKQLPCARREVELIAEILHTTPLTGKEATKAEVLKQLSNVALVHIAAHGRMETGEIALSPNPTRASEKPSDEDFLLTISDVLNVRLRARLVVLSCCHSGRGEIKAEGVVGIARAFLGAGARSVLVSLWAIDDKATLEFMKYFYQHLAEGKSASKSLNQAMKFMRESDEFSDVKYWAPFVLIGDDVTLEFQGSH